jgi:signal transduction histidine kinase
LGLAIAKNILDSHNATITVQSKEGLGTTFAIVFPPLA